MNSWARTRRKRSGGQSRWLAGRRIDGRKTPKVMGVKMRSLSKHGTAAIASMGCARCLSQLRRKAPAARRARTRAAPATQRIGIQGSRRGACVAGVTAADGMTVTMLVTAAGAVSVTARPAWMGGSSSVTAGSARRQMDAAIQINLRVEAEARRKAKADRPEAIKTALARIARLKKSSVSEFISNLLWLWLVR